MAKRLKHPTLAERFRQVGAAWDVLLHQKERTMNDIVEQVRRVRAAQWLAGRCYVLGYGVASDPVNGAGMIRQAADQGYARAQFTLGQLYAKGKGVAKDPAEAARCYQNAVDQGLAECYEWLALAYRNGTGVLKDPAKAKELCVQAIKAMAAGGKEAEDVQYALARMYETGFGVAQDDAEAVRWLIQAAHGGLAEAMAALADRYETGRGVPKDPAAAEALQAKLKKAR